MAILVLFEYFSGKLCLNFFTLILTASPIMIHFVRTFLIMRALRRQVWGAVCKATQYKILHHFFG